MIIFECMYQCVFESCLIGVLVEKITKHSKRSNTGGGYGLGTRLHIGLQTIMVASSKLINLTTPINNLICYSTVWVYWSICVSPWSSSSLLSPLPLASVSPRSLSSLLSLRVRMSHVLTLVTAWLASLSSVGWLHLVYMLPHDDLHMYLAIIPA